MGLLLPKLSYTPNAPTISRTHLSHNGFSSCAYGKASFSSTNLRIYRIHGSSAPFRGLCICRPSSDPGRCSSRSSWLHVSLVFSAVVLQAAALRVWSLFGLGCLSKKRPHRLPVQLCQLCSSPTASLPFSAGSAPWIPNTAPKFSCVGLPPQKHKAAVVQTSRALLGHEE